MSNNSRYEKLSTIGIITATVLGLYLSSLHSYLLFHGLIEITTIAIAFTIFILTWNTRRFLANNYLSILGIGYAFIALIDMLHTLAYKGMNVFPGSGANLPTQLWIAARSLQAVTLFIAPLCMERKMHHRTLFGIYGAVTSLLVAMIYSGSFPDCYIEGKGLTTFKIGSEYLMVALLLTSLYLLYRKRNHFDGAVYLLTLSSITCTALSGIMFTSYVNVYDVANMAGHFLKLAAFYLIYRAILVTGFQEPFALIFRDLTRTEEELRQAYETLEEKVRERTAELETANRMLQEEMAERKLAERKLQESEQRLRLSLEAAQIGIWDWDVANDNWCALPTYYTMLGYEPETGPGDRAEWVERLHPDDRALFSRKMHDVMSRNFREYEYEARMRHADGAYRWQHVKGFGIEHDQAGNVTRMLGVRFDITERKQTEELLRKREQEFRTLAENSPDSILRYDTGCRCIYANPRIEKTLGIPAGGMPGKTPMELFPAGEYREYQTKIEEVLRTGTGAEIEAVVPDSGEGIQHHHVRFTAERDRNDAITGVLVIGHDITERKRAEEKLRCLNEELEKRVQDRTADLEQANARLQELDRMKSMFIASMSHELRTPLNSVIGFSSVLLNEWTGPLNAEQKENLDAILNSGRHLLFLVNDVIDVSRIEADMIKACPENFEIHGLISEAVMSFENDAGLKNVELKVQAVHHAMHTDRTRLLQCLLNLVSNAVKFTEKGTISICAEISDGGGMLELSVADTGIGIKEEDIEKLFTPFVRLDSYLTSTVPGTGLGLYLAKKLAQEVLQGEITVTSATGIGSRFTLTVPISLQHHGIGQ